MRRMVAMTIILSLLSIYMCVGQETGQKVLAIEQARKELSDLLDNSSLHTLVVQRAYIEQIEARLGEHMKDAKVVLDSLARELANQHGWKDTSDVRQRLETLTTLYARTFKNAIGIQDLQWASSELGGIVFGADVPVNDLVSRHYRLVIKYRQIADQVSGTLLQESMGRLFADATEVRDFARQIIPEEESLVWFRAQNIHNKVLSSVPGFDGLGENVQRRFLFSVKQTVIELAQKNEGEIKAALEGTVNNDLAATVRHFEVFAGQVDIVAKKQLAAAERMVSKQKEWVESTENMTIQLTHELQHLPNDLRDAQTTTVTLLHALKDLSRVPPDGALDVPENLLRSLSANPKFMGLVNRIQEPIQRVMRAREAFQAAGSNFIAQGEALVGALPLTSPARRIAEGALKAANAVDGLRKAILSGGLTGGVGFAMSALSGVLGGGMLGGGPDPQVMSKLQEILEGQQRIMDKLNIIDQKLDMLRELSIQQHHQVMEKLEAIQKGIDVLTGLECQALDHFHEARFIDEDLHQNQGKYRAGIVGLNNSYKLYQDAMGSLERFPFTHEGHVSSVVLSTCAQNQRIERIIALKYGGMNGLFSCLCDSGRVDRGEIQNLSLRPHYMVSAFSDDVLSAAAMTQAWKPRLVLQDGILNMPAVLELTHLVLDLYPYWYLRIDTGGGERLAVDKVALLQIPHERTKANDQHFDGMLRRYLDLVRYAIVQEGLVGGGALLPYIASHANDAECANVIAKDSVVAGNVAMILLRRCLMRADSSSKMSGLEQYKLDQYSVAYYAQNMQMLSLCCQLPGRQLIFENKTINGASVVCLKLAETMSIQLPAPDVVQEGKLASGSYLAALFEREQQLRRALSEIEFRKAVADIKLEQDYTLLSLLAIRN